MFFKQKVSGDEQKYICPISGTTLEEVDSCPKNNVTIRERSERKNCEKFKPCQGHPLLYHCVRHENNLVEVCAPEETITGKHRAIQIIVYNAL